MGVHHTARHSVPLLARAISPRWAQPLGVGTRLHQSLNAGARPRLARFVPISRRSVRASEESTSLSRPEHASARQLLSLDCFQILSDGQRLLRRNAPGCIPSHLVDRVAGEVEQEALFTKAARVLLEDTTPLSVSEDLTQLGVATESWH